MAECTGLLPAGEGLTYPKPAGWEYMTHEERYATLRNEPKPDSAALQSALAQAKQEVRRDQGDERRAFQEAREAGILADAPHFTLSLSGARNLSLSKSSYSIIAALTYTSDPASTHTPRSVLFRPSYGPLSASAPDENLYSIYTTPTCTPDSRIPHLPPKASARLPRQPNSRFAREMEVATWDGWEEVSVGNTVRREVALDLDERCGWREYLEKGKNYWLRCDAVGLFWLRCDDVESLGVRKLGLDRYWRYGRKSEVELPMRINPRDPRAVVVPLEPSDAVEFEVVE